MKHRVSIFLLMMLLCSMASFAESFRMDVVHVGGSPLYISKSEAVPIPDGCLGLVIAKPSDDITISSKDILASFIVNGKERLQTPGSFFIPGVFTGDRIPSDAVVMRVCNASSEKAASGYWESPSYRIIHGTQQVSFPASQWTYHENSFKNSPDGIDGGESQVALVDKHELVSLYPNPFNSTTRITLNIEQSMQTRADIFDVNGRYVQTLMDGTLPTGEHQLLWNASDFSSGTYFLSVRFGDGEARVKRLFLVR